MFKKINQIYYFELLDNELVKYYETRYYTAFKGTNKQKKTRADLSNNYRAIKRYHFQIHQEETDSNKLLMAKMKIYTNKCIKEMIIKLQILALATQIIIVKIIQVWPTIIHID